MTLVVIAMLTIATAVVVIEWHSPRRRHEELSEPVAPLTAALAAISREAAA